MLGNVTAMPAVAQDQSETSDSAENTRVEETIYVTATRRENTIQDVPINIAALSGEMIDNEGVSDLAEAAALVPGLFIVDSGAFSGDTIVARGLNLAPLARTGNASGGTVQTYYGDIPIYVDLKLNDIDRVEFLLGPQGTLYGAGTLGGAIRYIPKKPQFGEYSGEVRFEAYNYSEGEGISTDTGATFNLGLTDWAAVRGSLDFLDDDGFIDYPFVVREPGVSNPDPDFSNPSDVAANLRSVEDANTEEVLSGRLALRLQPINWLDATLSYQFQDADIGGRTISHIRNPGIAAGKYESGHRILEPAERKNEIYTAELIADLGFAELTSATGYTKYDLEEQRDQTGLVIGLEYGYELFPSFVIDIDTTSEEKRMTQELRLVSKHDGALQWIVGGFYNDFEQNSLAIERAPGYAEFLGGSRPDAIEFIQAFRQDIEETALFGEISYELTDKWDVTLGGRYYDYEFETRQAIDVPLARTVFGGAPSDSIVLNFSGSSQSDSGFLYKLNTSYDFSEDIKLYGTISEGFRIGGSNGLAPCPDPLPDRQIICALPNELQYGPDKTLNYEIGAKTQWLDGRLTVNGSVYYIDWKDPHLLSATENGSTGIIINGEGAATQGLDLAFNAAITDKFTLSGSYGYSKAELTADTPDLVRTIAGDTAGSLPPGERPLAIRDVANADPAVLAAVLAAETAFSTRFIDGRKGDRLPGYPEHQYTISAQYTTPVSSTADLALTASIRGASDVLPRVGNPEFVIDGYQLAYATIGYVTDDWSVTLFGENLFDEFVETSTVTGPRNNQVLRDINGDPVNHRGFHTSVLPPRSIGVRLNYKFGR